MASLRIWYPYMVELTARTHSDGRSAEEQLRRIPLWCDLLLRPCTDASQPGVHGRDPETEPYDSIAEGQKTLVIRNILPTKLTNHQQERNNNGRREANKFVS